MPETEIHHPDKRVSTGAYSAGVLIDGWLYIAGQGPLEYATREPIHGTIEEQTRLTLWHVGMVLAGAGLTFDDVVKYTCHLAKHRNFDCFNTVYCEFFSDILPTRTMVQSVLGGGMTIDAIARNAT